MFWYAILFIYLWVDIAAIVRYVQLYLMLKRIARKNDFPTPIVNWETDIPELLKELLSALCPILHLAIILTIFVPEEEVEKTLLQTLKEDDEA